MLRTASLCLLIIGLGASMPVILRADDASGGRTLRAGMIGLDTSHVIAFAKIFNADPPAADVAGIRIVAGYPGGTDIPASRDRVEGFTRQLSEMGLEIVETIPELLERVDVVLLESVDGRIHLEEARPVIAAGKPLFIDKPAAGSLVEAIMIYELAERAGVPCFSSSSIRFGHDLLAARQNDKLGPVAGCDAYGPCTYQEGQPDLFFYGIHGVEGLFTVMGTGCQSVTRTHTEDTDLVVGVWDGGRIGTYRGLRNNATGFGFTIFGKKSIAQAERGEYQQLCREIAQFFKTGTPPVPAAETLEIFAFMEAADHSRNQGGIAVSIPELLKQSRSEALRRLGSSE
ncbi:MAG: gfo/Idh/MocA family oxidoreductase [Planctomycetaceae bacterium]|nr:gfo/Idh/MocA family oxidoreductase [Planctomycetaceae bacterium]